MEIVKVYDIAKELGLASKDVLIKASKMGLNVKSAQSSMTMEQAEFLANYIMNGELSVTVTDKILEMPKSKTYTINNFDLINIEIDNLKSIKNLKWSLKYEKGVHVIIAENGSGKSSLIIGLAKLVQPTIYALEFIGKGFEDSKISFSFHQTNFHWHKKPTWALSDSEVSMPKINGFFESSIHNGTRFKKIEDFEKEIEDDIESDKIVMSSFKKI